jgi:flagellum-specific peptidoglycan hydrolase FlgJ
MQKHVFNNLKLVIATVALVAFVIASAFFIGTFYPNKWTTQDIQTEFHKKEVNEVIYLGLVQPEFEFNDKQSFITATGKCIDYLNFTTDRMSRVPTSMIIAMAGIESGWGTSRFAREGNALFGVRTWDSTVPQMKPLDLPDADFGVKKYNTKCDSVKDMVRILNTHPAYEKFRTERERQIDAGSWDYQLLLDGITAWSTNPKYKDIIWSAIVDNNLP